MCIRDRVECVVHGHDIQHPALFPLHTHAQGVGPELLHHGGTRYIIKTQVVVDALGLVQRIVPVVAADHQYRLASGPHLDGCRQSRGASADYCNIVHWYSSSLSPNSAAITSAAARSATS